MTLRTVATRAGLLLLLLFALTPAVAGATYVGGVNTVTAPFEIRADVCPPTSGSAQPEICGFYLQGRQINRDTFAVCADCSAHNPAEVAKWRNLGHNTWLGKFRAPTVIQAGAKIAGIVTSFGHVGRYRVYQLADPQAPTLDSVGEGCLGLDISGRQIVHFDPSLRVPALPVIPCAVGPQLRHLHRGRP